MVKPFAQVSSFALESHWGFEPGSWTLASVIPPPCCLEIRKCQSSNAGLQSCEAHVPSLSIGTTSEKELQVSFGQNWVPGRHAKADIAR